jgi:4-amino-4-deoxy-L-arabinose transferase-like glycosyltransferase
MHTGRSRGPWAIAAIVLLIAAEARFGGLGHRSIWFDEAFSVYIARHAIKDILVLLPYSDTHPPVYYSLLGGWTRLFGSSETAVRGLSALASFLTVPVLYAFAQPFAGGEVALAAAALLAGSAFATVAGQEARMYALLGLLVLLSWSALCLALRNRKTWSWVAYVVGSALMVHTHYLGFLVLGSQVLYVIPSARGDRRTLLAAVLAWGAVALLFLPWLPAFLTQVSSGRIDPTFRKPAGVRGLFDLLAQFGFGGELLGTGGYHHDGVLPLWQEALVVLPVAALLAAGAYRLRGRAAWCLLCYWAGPIALALLLSTKRNVFYARYFSFLAPAFAVLLAAGIQSLIAVVLARVRVPLRVRSAALATAVALIVLANVPVANGYRYQRLGDYDWRGAASVVSRAAGTNDYLLFIPAFAHLPFEYYYKGRLERYELTPTEVYQYVREAPAPKIDEAWVRRVAEAHPRLWIVATIPMNDTSLFRLEDLLKDSFTPGHVWDFNDVWVFSLTSRVYPREAGGR